MTLIGIIVLHVGLLALVAIDTVITARIIARLRRNGL